MVIGKKFSVEAIGWQMTLKMLDQLPVAIQEAAQEGPRDQALEVVREAKRIVSVDTGHLRSQIFVRELGVNEFEIVAATDYAGFVEYGTSRMVARPFIRPALYRFSGTWGKRILDRFERKMRGYF